METKDNISFEISGKDFKHLKKFRRQHKNCRQGFTGEQFEYSFVPTGMGTLISVKCSCGQTLELGTFMDNELQEYDEHKSRPLMEADHKNKRFEDAAKRILLIEDPHLFRIAYVADQSFESIYSLACGACFADKRLWNCILFKYEIIDGKKIDNYAEYETEKEKIDAFYAYFKEHVKIEISKYNCENKSFLEKLGIPKE
ncbi:hypothetical protein SAMN02910339_01342 [Lachnospiraceae bacterium YSD2013]|nr:hypothetical protein SAMN02910339_01342 [Lachnospiraceae bacterium YSD2013]